MKGENEYNQIDIDTIDDALNILKHPKGKSSIGADNRQVEKK